MKNVTKITALAMTFACAGAVAGQAAVIGATGGESRIVDRTLAVGDPNRVTSGNGPEIIDAPANVNDDVAFNIGLQAFNEAQFVTLTSDLDVDGGVVDSGTVVSSHMIFLNSGPGDNPDLKISHGAGGDRNNPVSFQFDGEILGVMSAFNGEDEIGSSDFLGAGGTIYPTATFDARGLEGDPLDGGIMNDWYSFSGDTISLGFVVTEPGDWIRVITAAGAGPVAPVPVPASILLLGTALGGFGLMARRRRRNDA